MQASAKDTIQKGAPVIQLLLGDRLVENSVENSDRDLTMGKALPFFESLNPRLDLHLYRLKLNCCVELLSVPRFCLCNDLG